MTTQKTVTLTQRDIENPVLLLNAIVNAGLGESAPYLLWNIAVLRGATQYIALNQWDSFPLQERVAEYDNWKAQKYLSKFDSVRAKNSATPAVQPNTPKTAESPKNSLNATNQPIPTTATPAVEMTIPQWLESQYGLSESAVDSVILTLSDSHLETYAVLVNHAVELYSKDSPLGKTSRAYKAQTSAIRKALAVEQTRRKVYVDYMSNSATPTAETTPAVVPTESAVVPTESATPVMDKNAVLIMLAEQMKQQGAMLAQLMADNVKA
jgi:hypothetical protein